MTPVWVLIASFLIGSVPFAYVVGRFRGVDIRSIGSGNVGVTNLVRASGVTWGVVAFIGDAGKGALPVWIAARADSQAWLPLAAASAAVLGHCFTPFLRFRGGKGVATAAGALGMLQPIVLLILVTAWGLTLAAVRRVGVASSAAAVVALVVSVGLAVRRPEELGVAILLGILALLVLIRHRSNLREFFGGGGATRGAETLPGSASLGEGAGEGDS